MVIPQGNTVIIQQFSADAKSITIGFDPQGGQGEIRIRRGGKLTLHGASGQTTTSTLNGLIMLENSSCSGENCGLPELIIKHTHKFLRSQSALGKNLVGSDNLVDDPDEHDYGIIKGYDTAARLIFAELSATCKLLDDPMNRASGKC